MGKSKQSTYTGRNVGIRCYEGTKPAIRVQRAIRLREDIAHASMEEIRNFLNNLATTGHETGFFVRQAMAERARAANGDIETQFKVEGSQRLLQSLQDDDASYRSAWVKSAVAVHLHVGNYFPEGILPVGLPSNTKLVSGTSSCKSRAQLRATFQCLQTWGRTGFGRPSVKYQADLRNLKLQQRSAAKSYFLVPAAGDPPVNREQGRPPRSITILVLNLLIFRFVSVIANHLSCPTPEKTGKLHPFRSNTVR